MHLKGLEGTHEGLDSNGRRLSSKLPALRLWQGIRPETGEGPALDSFDQ
jgi:hypothetical protein